MLRFPESAIPDARNEMQQFMDPADRRLEITFPFAADLFGIRLRPLQRDKKTVDFISADVHLSTPMASIAVDYRKDETLFQSEKSQTRPTPPVGQKNTKEV